MSARSASAAVLQDNDAAIVIGARSGGAGCGYVNGGTATALTNCAAFKERLIAERLNEALVTAEALSRR